MKRIKIALAALGCLVVLASAHLYEVVEGVHFKGTQVDFGLPPPREALYYPEGLDVFSRPYRPGTIFLLDYDRSERAEARAEVAARDAAKRRMAARKLEIRGDYGAALGAYREMLALRIGSEGSVRERIDVLATAIGKKDFAALKGYLRFGVATTGWLRPYARYDSLLARPPSQGRAEAFRKMAAEFPAALISESALLMSARDYLSEQRLPTGDLAGRTPFEIDHGREALEALVRTYPKSRFVPVAEGWLARADFLQEKYAAAIAHYWRQLSYRLTTRDRLRALNSIAQCEDSLGRPGRVAYAICLILNVSRDPEDRAYEWSRLSKRFAQFSAADAKQFWECLRASPRALASYLDFRLDHTAASADLLELTKSAQVDGQYAGHIYARLAEAAFRLHRSDRALTYADQSLKANPGVSDRGLCTYIQASIAKRAGRNDRAIALYETLLKGKPKSYVAGSARENLALLYESKARLGDALDMYYALGYKYDVAYLLDMRMSPDQIAAYLRTHPSHPSRDVIRYTLGLRYLRRHQYKDAQSVLTVLPIATRKRLSTAPELEDEGKMQDALKTATDLGALERELTHGKSREQKAAALLAIGNYYYDHRNLLLYNYALWDGERSVSVDYSWNDRSASPADINALQRHYDEHECFYQALLAFKRLLTEFPDSPLVQRASYRAACAAERLSHFSEYWRWRNARENLLAQAVNLMSQAAKGKDRSLAASAKKYAKVFADSGNQETYQDPKELPWRRWREWR